MEEEDLAAQIEHIAVIQTGGFFVDERGVIVNPQEKPMREMADTISKKSG